MGGESRCVITPTGGKHLHLPRAVSARSVHCAWTSASPEYRHWVSKRKRHHPLTTENEEGGCAKGGLRRNEEEPELGEGTLPSPKQEPPRAPDPQGGSARNRRLLGTRRS